MKKIKKKLIIIIVITSILFCFLALGIMLYQEYQTRNNTQHLNQTQLIGEYQIDDDQTLHPIPSNGNINLSGYHSLTFTGHFTDSIPINQQIIFRTDNVRLKLWVNNQLIFQYGDRASLPENVLSPGNSWQSFISPGISQTDKITLEVQNIYLDHVTTTYASLLTNIFFGYESQLIVQALSFHTLNMILSIGIICFGILALLAAVFLRNVTIKDERLFFFSGLCISIGIWGFISFDVQGYIFPFPIFNNSIDIASLLFTMFFLVGYVRSFFIERVTIFISTILASSLLILVVLLTLFQLCGISDYYEALTYIQIAGFAFSPLMIICVIYEKILARNTMIQELFTSAFILAFGVFADAIGNFFDIFPYMIWFRISYILFIILQFINLSKVIHNLFIDQGHMQVLEELAYRDGLTNVGNRTAYSKRIEQLTPQQLHLVWVFDINNLKIINDSIGHEAGDYLIIQSADFLVKYFHRDNIYRIGGDEFIVIQDFTTSSDMKKFIMHFENEISLYQYTHLKNSIYFSMAYGYAYLTQDDCRTFESIVSAADQRMYAMKTDMKSSTKLS